MYNPNVILERRAQITQNITKGFTADTIGKTEEAANGDNLQKGEIMNQFGYYGGSNGKSITFSKTGKWLKTNLPFVSDRLKLAKADITTKMAALVKLIGVEPDSPQNSYYVKTIQVMRYAYDLCYPKTEKDFSGTYVTAEKTDNNIYCEQYNTLSYTLVSVMEDISCIETIVNNVEDKKAYELSISQITALGLSDVVAKGEIDLEDDDFIKSVNDQIAAHDALEKAEGSKGGKVIGHTKSGKAIYEKKNADHKDYKDFDEQDHKDAIKLHGKMIKKHFKRIEDEDTPGAAASDYGASVENKYSHQKFVKE